MRIRDALLPARSYLTILLGFLIGFAIVVWVEKQMPTRVESSGGIALSKDFPPLPTTRALTYDEAIWARVAWQYYVNNTQPNGLANASDGEPWLSLWSVGSYLFATAAAEQLNIISADEFDERVSTAVFTLGQLPLNDKGLPAAYYHADTLKILGKPDASAIGLSRLLTALQTLLWRYPQHAAAIRDLLSVWRTAALIENNTQSQAAVPLHHWTLADDEQRDTFGYRLYASHTLRLIDSAAGLAVTNPPEGQKMIDLDGVMVPDEGLRTPWGKQTSLISLPYLLTGLELGFDAQSAEIAWRIMQIQQRRHGLRAPKPPVSTDYAEPAPGEVMEAIQASGIEYTIFFYNPNIHPQKEYLIRKEENIRFAEKHGVPFVDADYDTDNWFERAKGMEWEPERGVRCTMCFDMRFERTALYAAENGFSVISSSLGISRWKNMQQINDCGQRAAARYPRPPLNGYNCAKCAG